MRIHNSDLDIFISRKNLFNGAYDQIMSLNPNKLKERLHIKYEEEVGIDAGGLLR